MVDGSGNIILVLLALLSGNDLALHRSMDIGVVDLHLSAITARGIVAVEGDVAEGIPVIIEPCHLTIDFQVGHSDRS